jgi:biopolymer transport protein ExbD
MAGQVGTGESSGGKRGRFGDNSEINVTPFVDVMLVLLIIFMVSAPLATISIPLDLPPPSDNSVPDPVEPIFVSLQDTGTINVGTQSTGEIQATFETLSDAIKEKTGGDKERKIFIRADQKVIYNDVMRLMDAIDHEGYKNKALVAEDVVD